MKALSESQIDELYTLFGKTLVKYKSAVKKGLHETTINYWDGKLKALEEVFKILGLTDLRWI